MALTTPDQLEQLVRTISDLKKRVEELEKKSGQVTYPISVDGKAAIRTFLEELGLV